MYKQAVTTSGIPSARRKLERANRHLAELRASVDAFRAEDAYDFVVESPGNERWKPEIPVTVTVVKSAPVPNDWALITGDILTNLRAALDHAVFPHIRAQKPDLDRKLIQYPIEDHKSQWENKKKWFKSPVTKIVGASQRYRHGEDFAAHPMRALRELVNQDKHRDLVIATYAVSAFNIDERDLYTVASSKVHQIPMDVGAVVAEAELRLAKNVVGERVEQIRSSVEYGEFIEVPGYGKTNLLVLQQLADPLTALFDELEGAGC